MQGAVTLFIVPGSGISKPNSAIRSWGNMLAAVHYAPNRKIHVDKVNSTHFAYMYDDEFLSFQLRRALPVYFMNPYWDMLILYRLMDQKLNGIKYFKSPRIFKGPWGMGGEIHLNEFLTPIEKGINKETVLDGFILGMDLF